MTAVCHVALSLRFKLFIQISQQFIYIKKTTRHCFWKAVAAPEEGTGAEEEEEKEGGA